MRAVSSAYNQLLLIVFMMIAYGLVGVYFFKGKLENRCRITAMPIDNQWQINENNLNLCGDNECYEGDFCGNPWEYALPKNQSEYSNNFILFYGILNFDNLGMSLFSGVLMLAQTGWSSLNDIVIFLFYYNIIIFFLLVLEID